MTTRNGHRKSLSQPERSFWREVFIARITFDPMTVSAEDSVRTAGEFADKAVEEFRVRVTWGPSK